jgi:outer membrane autotransporter protein
MLLPDIRHGETNVGGAGVGEIVVRGIRSLLVGVNGNHARARRLQIPRLQFPLCAVAITVLLAATLWPASDANAACAPVAVGATPSNTTVTCSGATTNQNAPDGYGTGGQANDIVNLVTGASVTGTNSGLNLGNDNTINLATGASVTGGFNGILTSAGTTTINNNNGGSITANGNLINAVGIGQSGGSVIVNNTGTISGTTSAAGGSAFGINVTSANVTNIGGNITAATTNAGGGAAAWGIVANDIVITNNTGNISATGINTGFSLGIFALNSLLVSANTGTISGTDQGISVQAGATSVNITNNVGGMIQGTGAVSAGIVVGTGATVVVNNAGTILGNLDGINTQGGGTTTITNSGSITGTTRQGIRVNAAAVTNNAGGLVSGVTGIFFRPGNGASSVFNAGTITGTGGTAIQFSTGSVGNTLTLAPTSAVNGTVLGAGSDIFQLGGTGSGTFNLSTIAAAQQYQGFSTFNKIDASTWTVTGTGNEAWTVQSGNFLVNGTINGAVNVTGGLLGGTGTVGTTTIGNGATLSPGSNGIGTLTVNGNLTLQSASLYLVGVTGGTSGRTTVSGTASIAGTAEAVFQGSAFQSQYTIVSAGGGRSGTFGNFVVVGLPAFMSASLVYTPTEVDLQLTSRLTQITGLTANQAAVAAAIDRSVNAGTGFLAGLAGVAPSQIPAALNALSGEGTSGTQETAFGAGNLFLTTMLQQGAFWRSGETQDANGVTYGGQLNYAPERTPAPVFKAMPIKAPAYEPRYRAWATGFDGFWSLKGEADPGSADLTHRTAGGAAGLDYQVNHDLLVGMAAGGSWSTFSVPDRATSGTLDGAHLGGYGVARAGSWYAAGTLAFSVFDNRTSRTIAGVGPTEIANGSFRSDLLNGRFELGVKQAFDAIAVSPFAAVQFAELWQRGYSETSIAATGAPGVLGLTYASKAVPSLPTFLGVQLDARLTLANGMTWTPYARASWVHEFEPTRAVAPAFIALPGSAFAVDGPRAAKDAARVDLGSKLAITRNTSLFGSFDGEFADRSRMYAGKGGLRVSW